MQQKVLKNLICRECKNFYIKPGHKISQKKREIILSLLRPKYRRKILLLKRSLILYDYLEIYVRSKMTKKCRNGKLNFKNLKQRVKSYFSLKNVVVIP